LIFTVRACVPRGPRSSAAAIQKPVVRKFLFGLLCPLISTHLYAATITGTVKDPSGAVISGARVEITGEGIAQPVALASDGQGKFSSPDLKPGKYTVHINYDGFKPQVQELDLHGSSDLQITLAIAGDINVVTVNQRTANSDAVYRQLRDVGIGETYRIDNFTLPWDAATFQFTKGTLTFLKPVDGVVTGAIFIGEGHFNLKPVSTLDARDLRRRLGTDDADEDFTEIVFRFTREAGEKFLPGMKDREEPPADAAIAFRKWQERMRQRREIPLGFSESILRGEDMDNVDADVLAALYNPAHPPFFNAYIHGKKHKDLRFFVRARVGALPQLDSPEEVALINYDPEGMEDGVWYLAHFKSEYLNHTANSREDRRLFATHRYKIETVIAKNQHLFSTATITFQPLVSGERVMKFGLLPNLRVTRVLDENGQNLNFIQESRKQDGSFYAILSAATPVGRESSITVEYAGDKVLEVAGGGSFYVLARTAWYPNLNGFGERAIYDLTFKVPHRYKVISVGHLENESTEQDFAVSHWVTPTPVAVAGFNYGEYQKMDWPDTVTNYKIAGYYLRELPDTLRRNPALGGMAPGAMTKYALDQTRAQLQVCTHFFGSIPYDNINITEQPDFNFGQSWPNLVYLPISAYIDATQRWMLFGHIDNNFTGFVQEVTPHEVAHQWWGHAVGWASYHDQWLSEGFAEFSAGLFLQQAVGPKWQKDYLEFWDRLRRRILDKNNFGVAPNDAGPIWMGERLVSPRSANAYQNVTYPKGAYILQMLRSIMWNADDQDKAFIEMMHDFVETHRERAASTESFKAVAEKHMSKIMDLQKNGRLDWFFNEWVYGTEVPRYKFEYQTTPAAGGKVNLHMTITESDVDEHFAMLVPIFADFGNGMIRIGQVGVVGNSTRTSDAILPSQPKKVALNAYKDILER
jgi:Peptidase family M1 domain/Carboxypeptidase regulatory-like domain